MKDTLVLGGFDAVCVGQVLAWDVFLDLLFSLLKLAFDHLFVHGVWHSMPAQIGQS